MLLRIFQDLHFETYLTIRPIYDFSGNRIPIFGTTSLESVGHTVLDPPLRFSFFSIVLHLYTPYQFNLRAKTTNISALCIPL